MCQWWIALDYLPTKNCQTHPCFLKNPHIKISKFKMLELGAALYHSRYHILLKRETLLSHSSDNKLFEAVVSKVLAHHEVKELVDYLRLAVQCYNLKAFERLAFVY